MLALADETRETVVAHGWDGLTRAIASVAERLSEAREHLATADPSFASAAALLREISELLSSAEVAERFTAAAADLADARDGVEAGAALVNAAFAQAAAAVVADLEVALHALHREIEEIAQRTEQCRVRIEDEGRRAEQFGSETGSSGSGLGLAEVTTRIQDLRRQGHGPQRHGARVTDRQLTDRVLYWIDPVTGTTDDADVPGQMHRCGHDAAKITSEAGFVLAERMLRRSEDFEQQRADNETTGKRTIAVHLPLSTIFGSKYQTHVAGEHRNGPKEHPTGEPPGSRPPTSTDFTEGKMFALFRLGPDGQYTLKTMYPKPKE